MGVTSGCGVRTYIDFLILLQQHPNFLYIFSNVFRSCINSRMQASDERRRVLHRRTRICMPNH